MRRAAMTSRFRPVVVITATVVTLAVVALDLPVERLLLVGAFLLCPLMMLGMHGAGHGGGSTGGHPGANDADPTGSDGSLHRH